MDRDLAERSEKLINELESIYISCNWREDPAKVSREEEIRISISEILLEADARRKEKQKPSGLEL